MTYLGCNNKDELKSFSLGMDGTLQVNTNPTLSLQWVRTSIVSPFNGHNAAVHNHQ